MKHLLFHLILIFCCSTISLHAGLQHGTLIASPHGLVPIESLTIDDYIDTHDIDGTVTQKKVTACYLMIDDLFEITTASQTIYLGGSQKIFDVQSNSWKQVRALDKHSSFLTQDGTIVPCISCIDLKTKHLAYGLILEDPHTFFATKERILLHNFAPAITIAISFGAGEIVFEGITFALGLIGLKLFKDAQDKSKVKIEVKPIIPESTQGSGTPQPPEDPDDKDKQNQKNHPHGKYEDAPYHHQNSKGQKSKNPKNGQKALDNSVQIKPTSPQRVGVSENEIVLLKETSKGLYHGHVVEWKSLEPTVRNALRIAKLATHKGKI